MPFHAFISYARRTSSAEAVALKSGVESYARKWNRARSTDVFLDDASLSAAASLEGTISHALKESEWLIVLLTEAAALSPWVDQEASWWLEHKTTDRILLVHVDGHLAWVKDHGFSQESTCVPPSLRTLSVEPRWVDLTWFSAPDSLASEDPRLAEFVLQVFCPLHGLDRHEAVALRDARVLRAKRLTRITISTLSILLGLALASGAVAVVQMRTAQEQTALATLRLLNSESQRLAPQNSGLARLLAAQAASMSDDDQTKRTLFGALSYGEHLVGELHHPTKPGAIATSTDGATVIIAAADGEVRRWDVTTRTLETIGTACADAERLQASNSGRVIVASCVGGRGFAFANGQRFDLGEVRHVAVSPSGKTIAYVKGDDESVIVQEVTSAGIAIKATGTVPSGALYVSLRDDSEFTVMNYLEPAAFVFSVRPWKEIYRMRYPGVPPEYKRILSRTGGALYDSKSVWRRVDGGGYAGPFAIASNQVYLDTTPAALSDSGDLIAYADASGGGIVVAASALAAADVQVRARLEAGANIGPIVIAGSTRVVAAHDGVISVWDLNASWTAATRHSGNLGEVAAGGELLVPNDSGSHFAYGDPNPTIYDAEGRAVWRSGGAARDMTWFLGWKNEEQFLVVRDDRVMLATIPIPGFTQTWAIPDGLLPGAWDASTNRVVLHDSSSLHALDLDSGESVATSLDGWDVASFSRDGSKLIATRGDVYAVWNSRMERKLYESSDRLELVDSGDVVVAAPAGPEYVALDGSRRIALGENSFNTRTVSPDGKLYLSTEVRGYTKIVPLAGGQEWGRVPMELFDDDTMGTFAMAAFSGDGNRIFIISSSGSPDYKPVLITLDLRTTDLVRIVCDTVRRGLEPAEWKTITGGEAPDALACHP